MTTRLRRHSYSWLVEEDIKWLMKQPRTLERDHIRMILDRAVEYEYGPEPVPEPANAAPEPQQEPTNTP